MVLTIGMPLFIASLGTGDHRNDSCSERNPPTPPLSLCAAANHPTAMLIEHMLGNGDRYVLGGQKRFWFRAGELSKRACCASMRDGV